MAMGKSKRPDSFGQVGGRQVDGDALVHGPLQCAGLQRGTLALARLLLRVGEADQGDAGQAVGEVHFHRDGGRAQRIEGAAVDDGERHAAIVRSGRAGVFPPRRHAGCPGRVRYSRREGHAIE